MPSKIVLFGGKLMGYWSGTCLRIFLSTKILVKSIFIIGLIALLKIALVDENTEPNPDTT